MENASRMIFPKCLDQAISTWRVKDTELKCSHYFINYYTNVHHTTQYVIQ